jgi:hypothetical protein
MVWRSRWRVPLDRVPHTYGEYFVFLKKLSARFTVIGP